MRRPPGGWPLLAAVAALVLVLTVLAAPPASWADRLLARTSGGTLRLADASGTLWQGRGRLVLVGPTAAQAATEADGVAVLPGVVLPGALEWRLAVLPLLVGRIDAQLRLEGMTAPLEITGSPDALRGTGGSLVLPPTRLDRLGSPWNTVQPHAALALSWEPFRLAAGVFEGAGRIELRDLASAMSPVRPLGSYAVEFKGAQEGASISMRTLNGPLQLDGTGTWTAREGVRFLGGATATGPQGPQIEPLLALLGRREGGRTLIRIGA